MKLEQGVCSRPKHSFGPIATIPTPIDVPKNNLDPHIYPSSTRSTSPSTTLIPYSLSQPILRDPPTPPHKYQLNTPPSFNPDPGSSTHLFPAFVPPPLKTPTYNYIFPSPHNLSLPTETHGTQLSPPSSYTSLPPSKFHTFNGSEKVVVIIYASRATTSAGGRPFIVEAVNADGLRPCDMLLMYVDEIRKELQRRKIPFTASLQWVHAQVLGLTLASGVAP